MERWTFSCTRTWLPPNIPLEISKFWIIIASWTLTLSGPAFSVIREAQGGSEARMSKIKVNINRLKWNLAWVIMAIKALLMQNFRLVALLVLEIWRHKISLGRRERVIKFGYLHQKNAFNFKKMSFYVQNRSYRPKIYPLCQFQQFSSRGNFFHF